jgi:hypothetical protein
MTIEALKRLVRSHYEFILRYGDDYDKNVAHGMIYHALLDGYVTLNQVEVMLMNVILDTAFGCDKE